MKNIFPLFLLLVISVAHGQTNATMNTDSVYSVAEQMPQAGYDVNEYIGKNLHYPDSAGMHGIQGRVIVRFIVNKDGSIDSCSVKRGIGSGCDEEAKRVLMAMPPWKPGMQNGQPVRVSFSMPVKFEIDTSALQHLPDEKGVYTVVDKRPEPTYNLRQQIYENVHYPITAQKNHIEGRVLVQFIINEDGSISDAKLLEGIGGGCDEEALRAIKRMPRWKPGEQKGLPVKVYFTQPIFFGHYKGHPVIDAPTDPPGEKTIEHPLPTFDLNKYFADKGHYPTSALKDSTTGVVVASFFIKKDGSIDGAKIYNGICHSIDNEVLGLLKNMPPWTPYKEGGVKKRVEHTIAIEFDIRNGKPVIEENKEPEMYLPMPTCSTIKYVNKNADHLNASLLKDTTTLFWVMLDVDQYGNTDSFQVLMGINDSFNTRLVQILKEMPQWIPAKNYGTPVKSTTYLLFECNVINGMVTANAADTEKILKFKMTDPSPPFSIADYLDKNLKYPEVAREQDRQGEVRISFVVNTDGSIGRCKIVSMTACEDLNKEALRVIQNMPKWKPGTVDRKPIPLRFIQAVRFELD